MALVYIQKMNDKSRLSSTNRMSVSVACTLYSVHATVHSGQHSGVQPYILGSCYYWITTLDPLYRISLCIKNLRNETLVFYAEGLPNLASFKLVSCKINQLRNFIKLTYATTKILFFKYFTLR